MFCLTLLYIKGRQLTHFSVVLPLHVIYLSVIALLVNYVLDILILERERVHKFYVLLSVFIFVTEKKSKFAHIIFKF